MEENAYAESKRSPAQQQKDLYYIPAIKERTMKHIMFHWLLYTHTHTHRRIFSKKEKGRNGQLYDVIWCNKRNETLECSLLYWHGPSFDHVVFYIFLGVFKSRTNMWF